MHSKYLDGTIEVITGPMFSGKSEELIKRIKTLYYANIKTLVIKHSNENRFLENEIFSRKGTSIKAFNANNVHDIKKLFNFSYQALAIDEIQFFENDLVDYLDVLANKGIKIIVSGLDQNFLRKPFGIIPSLMAIAENVTKLKAVCAICKNAAACSFRKNNNKDEIYIGNAEAYEARCRQCYYYGNKS